MDKKSRSIGIMEVEKEAAERQARYININNKMRRSQDRSW